jgi:hypothetical protein
MDDDLRWRIAIHEAGHSVAARLMGLPCGAASVWPDPLAEFSRSCGEHSVCALMAGAVAESLILGDYDEIGVMVDWRRASALMDDLGCDDDALWRLTFDLMAEHCGLIVRLAIKLFHARWLSGDEIDALVFASMLAS